MSASNGRNSITHQEPSHITQAMKIAATMPKRIHRVRLTLARRCGSEPPCMSSFEFCLL